MTFIKTEKEGYIEVIGGKVWYKIVGEKKETPLIVLHGGPGYPHDYLVPFEDLSDKRKIIFYDQLGCGNSEKPDDKSLWTVERFVDELHQIIKSLGLKKYHILGHSWGAALAVSFALTKPVGLKSIILADPYLSTTIWEKDAKRLIKKLPINIQESLNKHAIPGFTKTEEFQKASDEYYNQFVYRLKPLPEAVKNAEKKHSSVIYNLMWGSNEFTATGTLKNFDISTKLPKIIIPTLIICGRYDEATPESGKYFKDLMPNSQLEVFENSAHFPHWTDREVYMHTVNKFLKAVEL